MRQVPEHVRLIALTVDGDISEKFKADLVLQKLNPFPDLVNDPDVVQSDDKVRLDPIDDVGKSRNPKAIVDMQVRSGPDRIRMFVRVAIVIDTNDMYFMLFMERI